MPFEILEHTADVGIRARGRTLEELFEQATFGLLEIQGTWFPGSGDPVAIEVVAHDLGALLVDWLDEIIYLHDARDAVVAAVRVEQVERVEPKRARGTVEVMPRGETIPEGTAVKAVTFHRLRVEPTADGWLAEVYVDV